MTHSLLIPQKHIHMNLLLLEDQKSHASLFKYALEDLGWRQQINVSWVDSMEKAVDLLQQPMTIMIVDYNYKDGTVGTDFCRIARKAQPNSIILVMSSMEEMEIYEEAYKAGANAFIPKFEDFDELLDQLNCLLHYFSNFWVEA